ncbi:MAG: hypothetical protein AAGC74_06545 [Verrucomicrobiota bacterium]
MKNFKIHLSLLLAPALLGDTLTLQSGHSFSGDVLASSPSEGLQINTPRSPDTLSFKNESLWELSFEHTPENAPLMTERLILSNADLLPGNLTALDNSHLTLEGLLEGQLLIPREHARTLRFGIRPQNLVFQGPAPLENWSEMPDDWELDSQSRLRITSRGSCSQDVDMARQFILQFRAEWFKAPNIRLYFCDEGSSNQFSDRYYIEINRMGLQLKRENSDPASRWQTLLQLPPSIEAFDDQSIDVEIRGNRLLGTLEVSLDGNLLRKLEDPATRTVGTRIVIAKSANDNSTTYLSNLNVYSWDAVSQIHLSESPGSSDSDTLVDIEGKRMSGTISALNPKSADSEAFFTFASPFTEEPIQVPANRTTLIHFKSTEPPQLPPPPFVLEFINDGVLSANSFQLTSDEISLDHPLLGQLTLPRELLTLVRTHQPASE